MTAASSPSALEIFRKLKDLFEPGTRRTFVLALVGSIVVSLLDTAAIALVLPLVDVATGRGDDSGAVDVLSDLLGTSDPDRLTLVLTLSVVALFVLKDVGSMAFSWWMLGFLASERVLMSARVLDYYLTAPYTEMARRSPSELMRTMDASVLQIFTYTISGLMSAVTASISIVLILAALIALAPLPTLVLVVYFASAALLYLRVVKPRTTASGVRLNTASVQGWRAAFAALGAMKEVKLRGSHKHFVDGYRDAQLEGAWAGRTAGFLGGLPRYILEILFIVAVGVVLLLNASTTSEPTAAVGLIALFVAAGFRLLPAVTSLVASTSNIRVGVDSLDLVHDEVSRTRTHTATPPAPDRLARFPIRDRLTIEEVHFRYPGATTDVLRSVSLELPRGTSLAIVGTSGAGKTTLVDVILGLHRPTSGRVAVDGVDVAEAGAGWRNSVGYVPQDIYILDATLAENVAFDETTASIDVARVERVLGQAELTELAAELPDGIHTRLGERGTRLSGGQRQRVGIARALYRDPELLVFDEATSALDNETEHRIGRTIEALAGSITTVIVAHRLSTVRHADQVALLRDGRVEAVGTFDEVRRASPEFARLVELGSLGGP